MSESPFLVIQLICVAGAALFMYMAYRDTHKGNRNGKKGTGDKDNS